MKWNELREEKCSIAKTLSVIGERWTILILRDCFRGINRFDGFEASLGLPRAQLSERLKCLVQDGILEKKTDPEHARRSEYHLTDAGWDLRPVLITMMGWGDKYLNDKPPKKVVHERCGHVVVPQLHCPECGEGMNAREIKTVSTHRLGKEKVS